MKKLLSLLALCGLISLFTGCASLAPGADSVEVRAEQTILESHDALHAFLLLDNANRDFARTQAPAAHKFAEFLREPVPDVSGTVPRWIGLIESATRTRLEYKKSRGPDNQNKLAAALAGLTSAVAESQKQISQLKPK